MHRRRVYVDNSVISGTQDEEFAEDSLRFFELVAGGEFVALLSSITYDEMEGAPAGAAKILQGLPRDGVEELDVDDEVMALADGYVQAGVLTAKWRYDALHVAAASVAGADLIVSWNFEHMVNYNRIQKFNAVNLLNGYRPLDIRSPREVLHGNES
jgi:hypothetical protein